MICANACAKRRSRRARSTMMHDRRHSREQPIMRNLTVKKMLLGNATPSPSPAWPLCRTVRLPLRNGANQHCRRFGRIEIRHAAKTDEQWRRAGL